MSFRAIWNKSSVTHKRLILRSYSPYIILLGCYSSFSITFQYLFLLFLFPFLLFILHFFFIIFTLQFLNFISFRKQVYRCLIFTVPLHCLGVKLLARERFLAIQTQLQFPVQEQHSCQYSCQQKNGFIDQSAAVVPRITNTICRWMRGIERLKELIWKLLKWTFREPLSWIGVPL